MDPIRIEKINGQMAFAERIPSRYGWTRERLGLSYCMRMGMLVTRAGINYGIGWIEGMQLLAGVYDLESIKRVAPKANHDLFTPEMAYGPRVAHQVPEVIEALIRDPYTRQAVLFVGSPKDGPTSAQPCTSTIQLLLRDGWLNLNVNMRSWDIIKGLPYDIIQFSILGMAIGHCIGVKPGMLKVTAGSGHIYESDMDKIAATSTTIFRLALPPCCWRDIQCLALHEIETLQQGAIPSFIETEQLEPEDLAPDPDFAYDPGWE